MTAWSAEELGPILQLLAGRWVLRILVALEPGELRRVDLKRRLGGVTDKVLTETLSRLEGAGWVTRTFTPGVPPQVDYALTPAARSLFPALESIHQWLVTHPDQVLDPPNG